MEPPAVPLAETLAALKFPLGRLTTGTPPRLDGRTIDYAGLEMQPSDDPPVPFSFMNEARGVANRGNLAMCHLTRTNPTTHGVVAANRHLLPTFIANEGKGVGPRCARAPCARACGRACVGGDGGVRGGGEGCGAGACR